MKILGDRIIERKVARYTDCRTHIETWRRVVENAARHHPVDVRQQYSRSVDNVGPYTIFNIKHNSYRLIARIDYRRGIVRVVDLLTHAEYDREHWKRDNDEQDTDENA